MMKTEDKPAVSPEDLLKAAVAGKVEPDIKPAAAPSKKVSAGLSAFPVLMQREGRLLGVSGAALALGAVLGAGLAALSSPGRGQSDAVAVLSATLDANRIETARIGGEMAQLHQVVADLRASADAARKEAAARGSALTDRLAQADRTLAGKVAALGDRLDQAEREQGARVATLAASLDRRPAASATVAKPEPTQTGSLAEPRSAGAPDAKAADAKAPDARTADAKAVPERKAAASDRPPVLDGWALRDVFEGTAILENRRRRLVQVAPGDVIPGAGRVEGIERHGREWVVVTRQGLVTPQPW